MENPPIKTLYMRNLNEKAGAKELGRRVEVLVSRYARVLGVVVGKAPRLRGQAFVTVGSVEEAKLVKSLLHKFFFLGKVVDVHFARSVTKGHGGDAVPRRAKTFVLKDLDECVTRDDVEGAFRGVEGLARVRHVLVKRVALIDFRDETSCAKCFSTHEKSGFRIRGKTYAAELL